jgi:hypothetical protein
MWGEVMRTTAFCPTVFLKATEINIQSQQHKFPGSGASESKLGINVWTSTDPEFWYCKSSPPTLGLLLFDTVFFAPLKGTIDDHNAAPSDLASYSLVIQTANWEIRTAALPKEGMNP